MPHAVGAGPAFFTAFCASAVEFVEALTVVLAVGAVRGWRDALLGVMAGICVLAGGVAVFGHALTLIPLGRMQLVVGVLLLLFGMRWLRKATLRAAGIIPLHDEAKAYARTAEQMRVHAKASAIDLVAFGTCVQITMLEGLEVIFVIVALGAGNLFRLQICVEGALLALGLVVFAGIVIHRPLTRIPENSLKFVVGALLSAFGTFWIGEGLHFPWPGGDWALPALAVCYMLVAIKTLVLGRIFAQSRIG